MPFGRFGRSRDTSPSGRGGQPGRRPGRPGGRHRPDLPDGVVLLGREGCHLCVAAQAVVAEVCAEADTGWTALRLEDRPDLTDEYAEKVPVLFLAGRELSYWQVDPADLRRALRRRRGRR